jgi:hypothetical protein
MKLSTALLAVSLALNALLLAFLGAGIFSPSPTTAAANGRGVPTPAATAVAASTTARDAWNEVHATDLAAQVARLRAEDFPPAVIRAILTAQIREQFAARRKAIEAAEAEQPYWLPMRDPKTQAELRALARDEQKALKELLGPDAENNIAAALRRIMPELSPEKIEQLAQIRERYLEQRSALYANVSGPTLPDEYEKINALDKAMRGEFAAVLTPQELEDYNLRDSRTAVQLRNNLAAFNPTEQEFRTLFKLQSAFDEQYGQMGPGMSSDQMRARSEAQRQLNEQIKAALGGERYADYQRSTDYNFRRTTQLVARLNLPPETANELYALQQSVQQQAMDARRMATSPSERTAQLSALATDAEAKLLAKLGPSGLEAYQQYAGSWLNNLAPRPPVKR